MVKSLLKNYLFVVDNVFIRIICIYIFAFAFRLPIKAQVANYINNGSFEEIYNCISPYPLSKAKYWLSIDSSSYAGGYLSTCNSYVPFNGNTYQFPRTGNSYIISNFFCLLPNCVRGYMKNRLKQNLIAGRSYCVKFYVNIANTSPRGIDCFSAYFGDSNIDTITKCTIPLTYLNPQVNNPLGNVISDTLNWVPITGTFVANGSEKYALIGNFLADNAVTTASINTPYYPQYWTDLCIDDVSCVEVDLPAYAGPDKAFVPGDSVFIGRSPDFAVDPGCVWYQLPNATPIATISGLWVKPLTTTTYVVRQELDCSPLKWDTVVVYLNSVGINEIKLLSENLKIYPVPAADYLEMRISNIEQYKDFKSISIYNNLGQLMREEEIEFKDKVVKINTSQLTAGVYYLNIKSALQHAHDDNLQTLSKRFVVSR